MIWTKAFWKGCAERAIKTCFQSMAAAITVGATLAEIDWVTVVSVAIVATLFSIATSIGNAEFTAGKENEGE